MTRGFAELVLGGVFVAPFVSYFAAALLVLGLLQPVLSRLPMARLFSNPPLVQLGIFVVVLAMLVVLF